MNFDRHVFKDYRTFCGFTQEEFAKKLGVCKQTVQAWECGRAMPPEHQLQNINRVINEKLATFRDINAKEVCFGNVVNVEKNFTPGPEKSDEIEKFRARVISALIDAEVPADVLQIVLKIVKNVERES